MYIFIWAITLDQQHRAQLEAHYIYDGTFFDSPFPGHGRYLAFLSQNLYRLSSQHHEYPTMVTSSANAIYNPIPQICIQLMQRKRAQYCHGRTELAHPRVTKANFMSYLEAIHGNDVAFLEPVGDLEDDDEWAGKTHLFDR